MKRRERILVVAIAVLAIVVLGAGGFFVVLPQRSQTHTLDGKIAEAQAQLLALHRSGTRGVPTVDAVSVYDLTRAMPDSDDMPDALVELARLASASKATLAGVRPAAATVLSNGSSALPIQLTVNGSWQAVSGFLARLRNEVEPDGSTWRVHGRLFEIDTVQLTPEGDGLQALLGISAFDYGTPAAHPTTTTTTTTTTPAPSSEQAAGLPGEGS
ncbi:MAG TPA: type 4a pilus biogenesis protein PilO [Gaiellaceae bacterium]|nr:type 4a pilus biogenesis protein PilO [Gaiellaceae bacterium]